MEFVRINCVTQVFKQDLSVDTIEGFTHVKHDEMECFIFGCYDSFDCDFCCENVFGCRPLFAVSCLGDRCFLIESVLLCGLSCIQLRIFRNTDRRIIGLRFEIGPRALPGFCNGISIPWLISLGHTPSEARRLKIFAMSPHIVSGANFNSSIGTSSQPDDLFNFILVMAFFISSEVNGFDISLGCI